MNTLLTCLFIAMLLPYLAKGPVAWAMAKAGGYDNHHPRSQQAQLTGFGARALAGHQNAFESLLIFGLAVLTVIATGKVTPMAEWLAIVHIVARFAYQILYLLNKGTLRSLSWFVAIFSAFGIFFQAF
ncbi:MULTISPECIES: MAPEG family protein [Shewanella]|uniref:MAPEG family protein n=1 Tax=Shewanella TaxID=22 RepID=UPI000C12C3CB|nr:MULTISPECIES: MAPEG family protein [Shewanella]MCD8549439.1 MAPEG family protein [Shewanella xiamenensis]MCD8560614.1 MAPEG family protein [Shewanella xiamenensis]MCT8861564.1 MAPEG family protein [Shewanella xiamenensis]MDN5501403.1 MAPEG family protein [Shewanella sp.]MDN5529897.1 MAPEG family protein [Shewanella sp.]